MLAPLCQCGCGEHVNIKPNNEYYRFAGKNHHLRLVDSSSTMQEVWDARRKSGEYISTEKWRTIVDDIKITYNLTWKELAYYSGVDIARIRNPYYNQRLKSISSETVNTFLANFNENFNNSQCKKMPIEEFKSKIHALHNESGLNWEKFSETVRVDWTKLRNIVYQVSNTPVDYEYYESIVNNYDTNYRQVDLDFIPIEKFRNTVNNLKVKKNLSLKKIAAKANVPYSVLKYYMNSPHCKRIEVDIVRNFVKQFYGVPTTLNKWQLKNLRQVNKAYEETTSHVVRAPQIYNMTYEEKNK